MTIQAQLNNYALSFLKKVCELIKKAEDFERNQMINLSLRVILNSSKAIESMNEDEIEKIENDIIERFKFNEWI